MELHDAIPSPDNSIDEKKIQSVLPKKNAPFKKYDAEKRNLVQK